MGTASGHVSASFYVIQAIWVVFAVCVHWALAVPFNVTIDDTYGDVLTGSHIQYIPKAAWKSGLGCVDCRAQPDEAFAFNHTWHESVVNKPSGALVPTALALFEGSAIYVYCIIPDEREATDGFPNMVFTLDAEAVGSYNVDTPLRTGPYDYNVLVYANTSLVPGKHVLEIMNGVPGSNGSILLLDYILYTADVPADKPLPSFTPPPTPSASVTATATATTRTSVVPTIPSPSAASLVATGSNKSGIAIGASVGGSILLTAMIASALALYKKWKRKRVAPSAAFIHMQEARGAMLSGPGPGLENGAYIPPGKSGRRRGVAAAAAEGDEPGAPRPAGAVAAEGAGGASVPSPGSRQEVSR
ncbi:hypothetical protein C8Q77DRAFT_1078700 [Trametes polyzona]|nr:hypothetical protein C8Q77DRAFT_1078700 [Trametes polyzona]